MTLVRLDHATVPALAAFYEAITRHIPHCHPVDLDTFAATVTPSLTHGAAHENLRQEAVFVAKENGQVLGAAHVGLDSGQRPHGPTDEWQACGGVRFFAYRRGQRAVGQALLERAEAHLRELGATHVVVGHYDHRYPFYHAEHMFISQRLDHIWALLAMNNYRQHPHGSQVVLDWPDYAIEPPGNPPFEADIGVEWIDSNAQLPSLIVRAKQGEREIGICVCNSHAENNPAREAQDWVYTRWLGVDPERRGRGLGRHLLDRALHEARGVGYRHAMICCMGQNPRALLLYGNRGYRTVDWSYAWQKSLVEPAET